jgi:protein phosphatase
MADISIFCGDNITITGAHPLTSLINARHEQQDAAAVGPHLCAVADGIGGHDGGRAAALAALTAFAAALPGAAHMSTIIKAVDAAHQAVVAIPGTGFYNPGTTLVAVVASADRQHVHGIWVGDSRAYLISGITGAVAQLTRDHARVDGGLTRALGDHGPDTDHTPDTFTLEAGHGHRILLCSDGVSGPLSRDGRKDNVEIRRLLGGGLEHLVRAAAENGSDNATAVLVDVDALCADTTGAL